MTVGSHQAGNLLGGVRHGRWAVWALGFLASETMHGVSRGILATSQGIVGAAWMEVVNACADTGLRYAEDASWGTKYMWCHSSTSRPACATCLRGRDVLLGIDPTPALKGFAALREWLAGCACQVESE
ncbi:hypothetical protein EDB92DRAFT_1820058 [Lactarius akahatsu]|uniref:Uncharacterized protein n=1 Tax=Lactarius akahatsu TaxID=416441 RepID=A0AAD4LBG4_9AGAM|nr:hypothetical protein EDB92DRAFT_1820058 [Lactarius akahatsu]